MALGALFVLAACGGSGDANPSPTALPQSSTPAPTASAKPTPDPAGFRYTVQEGDTVSAIAARFGIAVDAIAADNQLADPAGIAVGQELLIKGSSYVPTPSPSPTAPPANPVGTGYVFPIAGACLPTDDSLMPNAPREYRNGIHEGVDFYSGANCVDVPLDTPALAVEGGTVIRADHNYVPLTRAEVDALEARAAQQGYTDAEALDKFRGRQVWIDHGNGIVSRYAHLNGIPDGIVEGARVTRGQAVGFVGDSGTPESTTEPGLEVHLHFELRAGTGYLGEGLPPDQVRYLYSQVFGAP